MPLLIVALGIAFLLVLMIGFRLNAFIALILTALLVGVAEGMEPAAALKSIESGVGSTLGSVSLILGFGAMLGSLIAGSGAAQRITYGLVQSFGVKNIPWAMLLTGLIVGIPMYYNAGFVLLIPIVFSIVASTKLPSLYVGIPMAAALSVTHGFLPPHPGPSSIAVIYQARQDLTLLYGLAVALPAIVIAGPLLGRLLRNFDVPPPRDLFRFQEMSREQMPGFGISLFTALLPVVLMGVSALAGLYLPTDSVFRRVFSLLGDPTMALLLSVLFALYALGIRRGKTMPELMATLAGAISSIAMIMLTIGGGGALKGVLVDSGVGEYIKGIAAELGLPPLVMAWSVAALLRVSLGSATVAALTTAGIVLPLISAGSTSPELMVLATGAGSLMFSHVNDPGFWMFKEYFNLSISQTFRSWSVMETIVSVVGLLGVLAFEKILF